MESFSVFFASFELDKVKMSAAVHDKLSFVCGPGRYKDQIMPTALEDCLHAWFVSTSQAAEDRNRQTQIFGYSSLARVTVILDATRALYQQSAPDMTPIVAHLIWDLFLVELVRTLNLFLLRSC